MPDREPFCRTLRRFPRVGWYKHSTKAASFSLEFTITEHDKPLQKRLLRKLCPTVHDWGQVCMFQGKNRRTFRAFTTYLYRAVDSQGNTLEFLLSATRDAEAAQRFFVKALHASAGSAPRARRLQEPVEEPMALADASTATSAPRVITVDPNAASPVEEPTALADPTPTTSAPRVINVDKHAAYPKAIAGLGDITDQVAFIARLFGVAA